jgi:hypothetical protein
VGIYLSLCSLKVKKKVQSSYQTEEVIQISAICYHKGISDLLIKCSCASFIILKAHLLKVPKITWYFPYNGALKNIDPLWMLWKIFSGISEKQNQAMLLSLHLKWFFLSYFPCFCIYLVTLEIDWVE